MSTDSYGLVLTLLIVAYATAAMWSSSWATSAVLLIQICTVWLGLRTSRARPRLRRITFVLMVLTAFAAVADIVGGDVTLPFVFAVAGLLYLVAPFSIIRHIAKRPRVDMETMLGAICAYLMFGMAFAFTYRDLGAIQSSPFFGADGDGTISQTMFFSFTTLTTTGYGDLVPAGNPGQSLAVFEMILGQLFLITAMGKIVTEWRPRGWRPDQDPAG